MLPTGGAVWPLQVFFGFPPGQGKPEATTMADALSITPATLSATAGLAPVAATLPATARVATDSSLFAAATEAVDLSTEGRLLSALATFQASLANQTAVAAPSTSGETAAADSPAPTTDAAVATTDTTDTAAAAEPTPAPPATEAEPTPPADLAAAIVAAAQSLADAFNTLLDSALALPAPVTTAPSPEQVAAQLVVTLTTLATTPLGADEAAPALPAIGLALAPSADGGLALQVDSTQLASAIATSPAATQATLSGATQALAAVAAGVEEELAGAAIPPLPPADLNLLGTATPPAASELPIPGLVTPTLPPVLSEAGADSAIILPADADIVAALQAAGLTSTSETTTAATIGTATAGTTATIVPAPTALPPAIATTTTAPTTADATTAAAVTVAAAVTPPAADVLAAEQRNTAASLALQTLLADPRLRAIDNQADPAYAAMIAATHLSDFDSPRPFTDPRVLNADSVGPVSALVREQAIADYREAAGEAEQRALIGTNTSRQYWV